VTGEEGGGTLLVQRVEELADAHRAYAQLFEVCQLQGDDFKLHSIMMRHRVTDSGNHLDLEQSAVAYVFDRYACWILLFVVLALLSCVNDENKCHFLAHDKSGMCRTSLVCPEQPVLCIPVTLTDMTVFPDTPCNMIQTNARAGR